MDWNGEVLGTRSALFSRVQRIFMNTIIWENAYNSAVFWSLLTSRLYRAFANALTTNYYSNQRALRSPPIIHDFPPSRYQSFFVLMRVPQSIGMTIMKKFTNKQIVKFQWYEKSLSVQLDIMDSIDILQFKTNWRRITACHAIIIIGYHAKNRNPK